MWRDLEKDPPTDEEYCVILFPCKTDCGLLYVTSNPKYARGPIAIQMGYTHWCKVPLAPDHDKWVEWQNNLEAW